MTYTDPSQEYSAPTSQSISDAQDTNDSYRLLLAQRKLYSQSKRWLTLRWFGMLVIAVVAPVAAVVWPNTAVAAGAMAGAWIFVGRTWLFRLEQQKAEQAAAVQEIFDQKIFGMPCGSVVRSALPSLEEISLLAGSDGQLKANAVKRKLTAWYPIDTRQEGLIAIAICQRANASYSDRLLKMTALAWMIAIGLWIMLLAVISVEVGLSAAQFVLGIVLPLLPAFLDVWEYRLGIRRAACDRCDLVRTIEEKLKDKALRLEAQDVLVWQSQLYDLRRGAPQVPDLIYRLTRSRNEAAMESTAQQLSIDIRGER